MGMVLRGLLSLKGWVIIGFIVYWNIGMGIVIYLNGGLGEIKNENASYIGFLLCFSIAVLSFLIIINKKIQKVFITSNRENLYNNYSFGFLAIIALFLSGFLLLNGSML